MFHPSSATGSTLRSPFPRCRPRRSAESSTSSCSAQGQLADRSVTIELDASARAWLAEKGYDPLFGARLLARVIQEHIKKPLADELLFGRLSKADRRGHEEAG